MARAAALRYGFAVTDPRIRIGIGGWTYPPWRGAFYPPDLPQRAELEFAAQRFGAIEINATFYGRQSPKSWAAWGEALMALHIGYEAVAPWPIQRIKTPAKRADGTHPKQVLKSLPEDSNGSGAA